MAGVVKNSFNQINGLSEEAKRSNSKKEKEKKVKKEKSFDKSVDEPSVNDGKVTEEKSSVDEKRRESVIPKSESKDLVKDPGASVNDELPMNVESEQSISLKAYELCKLTYENLIQEMQDRLSGEEDAHQNLSAGKKKLEGDISHLKKDIEDLELSLQKVILDCLVV